MFGVMGFVFCGGFSEFRATQGLYREHGNYYSILGLNRDNGKEHGNYYNLWVI